MTDLHQLQFYATPDHPCSYLLGRQAKTLFVDPKAQIDKQDYSLLSELGFRRSGAHIYRPHCSGCQACISARVNCSRFKPSRNQRRILRANSDITHRITLPQQDDAAYDLYQRYISARHADGDMYPPTPEQFESFLVDSDQSTRFMRFELANKLVAVAVIDELNQGLSAIYTFYDPALTERSLGTFAILSQIRHVQTSNKSYLYLGYWISNCRKMSYKLNFQPIELLLDGSWIELDPRQELISLSYEML